MNARPLHSLMLAAALILSACGGPPSFDEARSKLARDLSPSVAPADAAELVAGNAQFGLDLLRATQGSGNALVSPHSVSVALAMTYAGARGTTEAEMSKALRFTLPQARLHPAFDALDLALQSRGQGAQGKDGQPFRLKISNAAWALKGYHFEGAYLDTLATSYGAGVGLLDFANDPESSRQTINDFVAYQTEDRIKDLLGPGAITPLTRLVLTNALYFNAAWAHPFEKESTSNADFHLSDGSTASVPTLHEVETLGYAAGADFQAVELPYQGGELSMVVLVPTSGTLDVFQASLDAARLQQITSSLAQKSVGLSLPRFKFDWKSSLKDALVALGMPTAFSGSADFTGMSPSGELSLGDVIHQTTIVVDEAGTEAAAATAVVVVGKGVSTGEVAVTVDRPFLFLIRDVPTGAVVFAGRVMDPR